MLFVTVPIALTHFRTEKTSQCPRACWPPYCRADYFCLKVAPHPPPLIVTASTISAFLLYFLFGVTIHSQDYIRDVKKACLCHNCISVMLSTEGFLHIGKL